MVEQGLLKDYIPFWNQISSSEQQLIETQIRSRKVSKGTLVHSGETDCLGLIFVITGSLRAYTMSETGKTISLYRLLERDMCLFAASCVMRNIDFEVVIEAREDTEILVLPVKIYQQLMNTSLPVANYTNELMASRFSDVMWVMDQVLNKSFDVRLATFLLEEQAINESSILYMTHEEIAQNLGSAREVVTRMLKYFHTEELVNLARGKIEIVDVKALEKIVNQHIH
ncbi:MAG: Crp/Fnr family transcriptional regulator [Lachnospiraceae bacterium]